MNESERLTIQRKAQLAQKYSELNTLLGEKKRKEDRLADLMQEANRLRVEINRLDHRFHTMAIKVEPTEVVELKQTKTNRSELLSAIMKKVSKEELTPELMNQLINIAKGVKG